MKNDSKRPSIPGRIYKLFPPVIMKGSNLAWLGAFLLCLVVILLNLNSSRSHIILSDEFEVGRVADRDVIAERYITYEDERATRLRIEAQERLVPAVFNHSERVTGEQQQRWRRFASLAESLFNEGRSRAAWRLALHSEFPGYFPDDALNLLYESGEPAPILNNCALLLDALLYRGIYSIPQTGLENLNPDVIELIRHSPSRIEQERIPVRDIIGPDKISEAITEFINAGSYPPLLIRLAPQLLEPFLVANVFYSPDDTAQRIVETRLNTEPVMRTIEQGRRVIRKGFMITEEDMAEFQILRMTLPENDLFTVFSLLIFLLLLFGFLMFFCSRRIAGRNLLDSEVYLVAGISALYIAGSVLVRTISIEFAAVAVVVPTALVIMLPSILINARLALLLAMALPLGAFLTGSFDAPSFVFALVSGVVASYSLQGAEKRMDLVKAGLVIAAANITAMLAILLWRRFPIGSYPFSLFWAAFNGIASGMLVLGVLSPLEQALNAATSFRLIELSDLNAPVLKRLFTAAPGTYSHSIMVANLAEAACQDIEANPLLARVGAYYHDLGKMENPAYFVENQTDYNRHDDMAPRLSATVIRSHVKLGVEKARQLALPREVIEIISEHHGNSVITWFYDKALKQEAADSQKAMIKVDDFSYPGTPPRSRESAVVMLADMAEAAVRTLEKPTAVKIEKFVQELIAKKVENGQLSQSELTFRDLETIKNAFVRVLTGYYHTRIEYPKIDGQMDNKNVPASNGTAET